MLNFLGKPVVKLTIGIVGAVASAVIGVIGDHKRTMEIEGMKKAIEELQKR